MAESGQFLASASNVEAVRWVGSAASGSLLLLDQRRLPLVEEYVTCRTAEHAAEGIRSMVVRGAPAIGLAAAWGVVLAAQEVGERVAQHELDGAFRALAAARPTAVNLAWALHRMRESLANAPDGGALTALFRTALRMRNEEIRGNQEIGRHGAALLPSHARLLTYCNTGSLATAGYGTALGVVRSAFATGRLAHVIACETRPFLQGARLTMWELLRDQIPALLATDNMVGHLMQRGSIDAVLVGADRIAANGDTANKIGTYTVAVLARHHGVPFYVVAPTSTIDLATPTGTGIPIEERSSDEVTRLAGTPIAPPDAIAMHPAFDVTPAELISAIVTERGVARPPYGESLAALLASPD